MQEYPLKIPDNRKVNSIKSNTAKPIRPSDRDDSSTHSKDKRTTASNRRRQRHSTEIGSEYYRWWAVRSALGFQTNEHIAGLLLDGFHALLQHIVSTCGGDEYPGRLDLSNTKKGKEKQQQNDPNIKPSSASSLSSTSSSLSSSTAPSSSSLPSTFSSSSLSSSLSTSDPQMSGASTNAFNSSLNSPPGAEDMEGFSDFNQAIAYYTNALRWMCAQPDNGLLKMRNASPVLQDFLVRLNRYLILGGGRSLFLNDRKKTFPKDSPCLISLSTATSHVNTFNISALTFAPQSANDLAKQTIVAPSHTGLENAPSYPSYITPSLTPLMLSSKTSAIVPKSAGTKSSHHEHPNSSFRGIDHSRNTFRIVGGKIQDGPKMSFSATDNTSQPPLAKEKAIGCRTSFPMDEEMPHKVSKDSPSKLEIETKYSYRMDHDVVSEHHKWSMTKEYSTSNGTAPKHLHTPSSSVINGTGNRDVNLLAPDIKQTTPIWNDKNSAMHLNETKSNYHFSTPTVVKETLPKPPKAFAKEGRESKNFHHTFSQGAPLLFVPAQQMPGASEVLFSSGGGGLTNVTHKFVYNSPVDGFYGQPLSNSNITSSQKSQCLTYPPSSALQHSVNQLPKQRPLVSQSPLAVAYTPPFLTSSRSPSITNTSMIPLFYSPAATSTTKIQTPTTTTPTSINLPWTCSIPSYNMIITKDNGSASSLKPFICNQNNTMRDNFNLFRMYQDISKPGMPPYPCPDKHGETNSLHFGDDSSKKNVCSKSDLQIKTNPTYPHFLDNEEKHQNELVDSKDPDSPRSHYYNTGHSNHPLYLSKSTAKSDYNNRDHHGNSFSNHPHHAFHDRDDFMNAQYDGGFTSQRRQGVGEFDNDSYNGTHDSDMNSIPYSLKTNNSLRNAHGFSSPVTATTSSTYSRSRREGDDGYDESQTKMSLPTMTTSVEEGHQTITSKESEEAENNTFNIESSNSHSIRTNNSSSNSCRSSAAASSKPRRYVCSTCGKVLHSGIDLVVHRYEQHSHVCGECDGRFLSLARLQQHKACDHPQMLVCPCPHCKFTTFCEDYMEDHKRSHHAVSEWNHRTADGGDECAESSSNKNTETCNRSLGTTSNSQTLSQPFQSYSTERKQRYKQRKEPLSLKESPNRCDKRDSFLSKEVPQNLNCTSSDRKGNEMWTQGDKRADSESYQSSKTPNERPCPGSVFPAFNKSTSCNLPPSKVDSIVNIFSQVNDHCRFDQSKYLPSSSKAEESNEADSRESVLVIDTSSGSNSDGQSKEQSAELKHRLSSVNEESKREFGNCVGSDGSDVEFSSRMDIEEDSRILESGTHCGSETVVLSSGDCHGQSHIIGVESDKANARKRPFPVRLRKRRRKGQTVKYSSKKFKSEEEYSKDMNDDGEGYDTDLTHDNNMVVSKSHASPSDFEINEESAQNSVIKPHTVWLDDCQNMKDLENQNCRKNCNTVETWSTIHRTDENCGQGSYWKLHHSQVQKCSAENTLGFKEERGDTPSPENKSDVERQGDDDMFNNRILSLRERHRSHSLPPKKRSIRK